jgi:phage regulator Rha-like protein
MNETNSIVNVDFIQNRIFTIRGEQVMLDSDLAEMYEVELKRLNEQVKRNIERFPETFRFQLTDEEADSLRSQFATLENNQLVKDSDQSENLRSQIATIENEDEFLRLQNDPLKEDNKRGKHRKYLPYVFTEQGVSMLSAVLRSKTAIKVSITIMNAFVEMRKFISTNASIFNRLDTIELKQLATDQKFEKVLKALESKDANPKQGVFFDGQIFDSYKLVSDIIRSAKLSIVLIDNYVDDTVLSLFSKKDKKVNCSIFTKTISKQLKLDAEKFNKQYPTLKLKQFNKAHDRFLIIDENEVCHIGASLKDLGKKWFAFSKMDRDSLTIINSISEML